MPLPPKADSSWKIVRGDCLDVLRAMPDGCVDAVLTDPPYCSGGYMEAQKPVPLLRELLGVVCPPGGTVLDPFSGSGSTGEAALLEGMKYVGVEKEPGYADASEKRLTELSECLRRGIKPRGV